MALSASKIQELYATGSRRTTGTGGVKIKRKRHIFADATGDIHRGDPKAEIIGQFVGKTGSVQRSRKGASRIQANGSRRYVQDWNETILWYQA